MNETILTILKRRSVRKYADEQIKDDELNIILQTALYAPTGGNHQYTRFIVVQNQNKLKELNEIVRKEFSSREIIDGVYQNKTIIRAKKEGENYNFMFHAPALVVAISPKNHGNSMADSANALENIQIAATSLGLGACWVNQLHWLTDFEPIRKFMYELGMSEDDDIYGSVVLGHPALRLQEPSKRKDRRIIIIK